MRPTSIEIINICEVKNVYNSNDSHAPHFIVNLEVIEGKQLYQHPLDYFKTIETSVLKTMVWQPPVIHGLPRMESKLVIDLIEFIKH
jgi:hypothetical protein